MDAADPAGVWQPRLVQVPDPPDREPEPAEAAKLRLGRRRPYQLPEQVTRLRALDRDVVQMVGGVLDPDPVQVQPPGELAQPGPVVLVAADEAEGIGAEPEHGRVVEHPAGLVADRGVYDLAGGELADVAGDGRLQ